MKFGLIADLITFSRTLYERRLVHAEGGNTSVRIGDDIWITRTGAMLGRLSESDLCQVSRNTGELIEGGQPSKELPMHLAIYQARPEAQAVIHIHPTYAIAYSTLLTEPTADAIPTYTSAFYRRAGRVPMTDYYPVGSPELHEAVSALAPYYHAILLRQHGVTVAAPDMSKAIGIVEEIEQCCHIALLTNGAGIPITQDEKDSIDALQDRVWPER